ncbi:MULTISPECIES: NAD(P)H-dependent oxidoreductase [unclassified Agarivorans]|uniref:NAD(P)H-dependent oxidoreductase n=1 Tax=unclassified Agarivorans TaxID=2636026 RepID=UPI003D7E6294
MKVLIALAHPDVNEQSIANKIIIERLVDRDNIEVRDLYRMYPDFNINVDAEQKALLGADIVIFQYPFHWYSMPGMLKEWLDRVFLHGFAHGDTGDKLKGKSFMISTTIGGPDQSYSEGGLNSFTVEEFLKPLQQIAKRCGMIYHPPIVSHNMVYIPDSYGDKLEVEQRAVAHANKLVEFINSLDFRQCN